MFKISILNLFVVLSFEFLAFWIYLEFRVLNLGFITNIYFRFPSLIIS